LASVAALVVVDVVAVVALFVVLNLPVATGRASAIHAVVIAVASLIWAYEAVAAGGLATTFDATVRVAVVSVIAFFADGGGEAIAAALLLALGRALPRVAVVFAFVAVLVALDFSVATRGGQLAVVVAVFGAVTVFARAYDLVAANGFFACVRALVGVYIVAVVTLFAGFDLVVAALGHGRVGRFVGTAGVIAAGGDHQGRQRHGES
jgi:hypothetical protein